MKKETLTLKNDAGKQLHNFIIKLATFYLLMKSSWHFWRFYYKKKKRFFLFNNKQLTNEKKKTVGIKFSGT